MMTYILPFLSFLLSALCGFIAIPVILNFCKEKGLYDLPDARKIHLSGVPRLGGISFLPSMFLAFLAAIFAYNNLGEMSEVTFSLWSLYFFISLMLIYGIGLIDDIVGLGAKAKFSVQIMAAGLLPLAGLYINNLYGFCGVGELPYSIGFPLTIFIIVFITNAINLIDGIDGLAAGLSLIALGGFLACFLLEGIYLYAILIAGLMGVLIPFLYFNLFGTIEKNRKIFMGDSGSLTLGFILGFLAVKFAMDNPNVKSWNPDCLLLSYTFLIVPCFDVVRVSLLRMWHHKPVFSADKNHIHHKLMRMGLTQHQTLVCILSLAVLYILLNVALCRTVRSEIIVGLDIIIWLVFHSIVNRKIRQAGKPVFQEI